jgi:hypothetical protein
VTKRPIDRKRDSGGRFDVGTVEEGTVGTMIEIDGSLYIIKDHAIYALQTADQIDPERTNIALPNILTRPVLAEGSQSELVGKTLLTAVSLFDKGKFLPKDFDHRKALSLSFEALTEMLAMRTAAAEFEAAEEKARAKAPLGSSDGRAAQLPFMGDVKTPCRAYMQQAHHAAGTLLAIVQLFYPDIKKAPWDALATRVGDCYGADDGFTQFLGQAVPFLKGVLNVRDCLEHKNTKDATVSDFTLQSDGQIIAPAIEVDFRGTRQPSIPISQFMGRMLNSLMTVFEIMIFHLCNKHFQPPAPILPVHINTPADNRRRWKHVRFYYGTLYKGEFIPVG